MSEEIKHVSLTFGSVLPLLLVAFIVLKLCNVITWSWLWVLAPLWIPLGLGILIFIFLMILIFIGVKKL